MWLGKSINPHFSLNQSYRKNFKFTCCFKNGWKMAAIISICTLNPKLTFKPNSYLSSIFRRGPVHPLNLILIKTNLTKKNYKFTCWFKIHWKMAAIIFISTLIPLIFVAASLSLYLLHDLSKMTGKLRNNFT